MLIMDPEYHGEGGYVPLMFFHGCGSLDFYGWKEKQDASLAHGYAMLAGALDVRRLQESITEFPKAVPQAAILYCRGSIIQAHPGVTGKGGVQTPYTLELEKCYRAGNVLDTPLGFVTTRMARQAIIPKETKVLIVPGAYYANEDEVNKVLAFARSGGTVVVMPTSFVADEYNRRRMYLKDLGIEVTQEIVPKYLAGKAKAGVEEPGSEYDFIQGPIAKTVVEDQPKATITWKGKGAAPAKELAGLGIRQTIKLTGAQEVLATYEDATPAIVRGKLGTGQVIYVAMQLEDASAADLLDWVYAEAGVKRPVRVVGFDGKRVPGVESRTVPCIQGYLTYLYNLTDRSVKAKLRYEKRPRKVENLTTGTTPGLDWSVELGPYEWCVLRLDK
jgi:beta-galactosidase GanA